MRVFLLCRRTARGVALSRLSVSVSCRLASLSPPLYVRARACVCVCVCSPFFACNGERAYHCRWGEREP